MGTSQCRARQMDQEETESKGLKGPGSLGAKAGAGWDSSHLSVGAENQMSASELSLVTLNSPYRQWREIAT